MKASFSDLKITDCSAMDVSEGKQLLGQQVETVFSCEGKLVISFADGTVLEVSRGSDDRLEVYVTR